jgi:hypothetical protein
VFVTASLAGNTVIHGEFFVARGVPVERVVVTEGTLFIAERGELQGAGASSLTIGESGPKRLP